MAKTVSRSRSRRRRNTRRRKVKLRYQRGGAGSVLVLYCYKEDPDTKKNLEYFIRHGVVNDPTIQYRFLINTGVATVTFPSYSNVKVIRRKEDEYDLLSYKWYLNSTNESADTVFFINSSCRGPIEKEGRLWIEHFQTHFAGADFIAPVFTFLPKQENQEAPFLHTYMFGVTRKGLQSVLQTMKEHSNQDSVYALEKNITWDAFKRGFKITTLLSRFKGVDLSNPKIWDPTLSGIPSMRTEFEAPGMYFGGDLDPREVVFFKNIRRQHAVRTAEYAGISKENKEFIDSLV